MLDALFEHAKRKKLRISNLVEGTNGTWHCYVYRGKQTLHGVGFADNAIGALELALSGHSYIEKEPASLDDQFKDILG